MLSLFPLFLSWNLAAALVIRVALGAVYIFWSYRRLTDKTQATAKSRVVGILDAVIGVLLVIGMWTQLAALVIMVDLVVRIIRKALKGAFLTDGVNYYLLLLVLAFALVVSGAGWLALDLSI